MHLESFSCSPYLKLPGSAAEGTSLHHNPQGTEMPDSSPRRGRTLLSSFLRPFFVLLSFHPSLSLFCKHKRECKFIGVCTSSFWNIPLAWRRHNHSGRLERRENTSTPNHNCVILYSRNLHVSHIK